MSIIALTCPLDEHSDFPNQWKSRMFSSISIPLKCPDDYSFKLPLMIFRRTRRYSRIRKSVRQSLRIAPQEYLGGALRILAGALRILAVMP